MNILEQKRKLLGHCYMGGGGSNSGGGGGNGGSANDGNAGEAEAKAYAAPAPTSTSPGSRDPAQQAQDSNAAAVAAAAADAARAPVGETAREAAPVSPVSYAGQYSASPDTTSGLDAVAPAKTDNSWAGNISPAPVGDPNIVPARNEFSSEPPASETTTTSGLDAVPTGEDRGAFVPTSPLSIAQTAFNDARQALVDKISKETGLPSYAVRLTPAQEAGLLAKHSTTIADKWLQPATKNAEAVERNDLKFDISPAQLLGETPDRATLKALSDMGLGGVYGVGGINPGQNADNIVAAQNVNTALTVAANVLKNFIPGYGIVQFAANVLSGKTTPGQAIAGVLGDRVASLLGVPPSMFQAAFNGNYGDGLAGWATSALNSYIAKETKTDPRLTAMVFSTTGLPSLAKTSLSSLNVGPNISGAAAKAIDSGLSSVGIGKGPATTSSNVPSLGMDSQSQVDNILNSGGAGSLFAPSSAPAAAPSSAPAATGNISSTGPSSESHAGALSAMANSGPSGGTYRIGNTNYTPYSQDLAQLNLTPDEFTKQSDIGNIPVYNTDVAKMASAPFMQSSDPYAPYAAAAGGSIRHFDEGGDVAPAPTADQLEKRAALQAQAEYYKNLDSEKQNADIMSALKNLSGVGAAEAKPQSSPLIRLGQVGQYTPPKVLPQLAALLQSRGMRLAEGGQPDDHSHPNYDGTPVFRTGGLSGLGGKYVEGKGDGTSDDITAMLADGEYVFSADVVSALGNGSNKAGAQVLDKTVEAIRSRARSAPPDKLPPDAKSPLEYMQAVKGKKYG